MALCGLPWKPLGPEAKVEGSKGSLGCGEGPDLLELSLELPPLRLLLLQGKLCPLQLCSQLSGDTVYMTWALSRGLGTVGTFRPLPWPSFPTLLGAGGLMGRCQSEPWGPG